MKKILAIVIIGILILSGPTVFATNLNNNDKENLKNFYTNNWLFPNPPVYDLVIIAPSVFSDDLQPLIKHKNDTGIKTILKTTEEIYGEFNGVDPPEDIKFFIKDAKEKWNMTYVLLVGGLKSKIWATPRENTSYGAKDWHVPVRYTNMYDNPKYPLVSVNAETSQDPGCISDLYYADIYDSEGNFSSWDTNGDGIFAAWGYPDKNIKNDTGIDLVPDVSVGRLACVNKFEVRTVVDKIINYEKTAFGQEWFKKMMVFSGDGFLDQKDLDIQWNTTGLPNGKYTIYAQSENIDEISGDIDSVTVTINKNAESKITFVHDDNLQVSSYPARPVAEITSPSNGDTLGKTDVAYSPQESAYDNEFTGWANVNYTKGVMHIRGKSYDPRPYGVKTNIHVWIEDINHTLVFSDWRYDLEMYFEGEWTTGERELNGRGGALFYMPDDFEKDIYWGSNGRLTGQKDVINALSKGCGFVFMSGHGSPNVWADHLPGIPGDRKYGSFTGLKVTGLRPWSPYIEFPISPMNKIKNNDKLPVVVIGGCHNSQFNVSLVKCITKFMNNKNKMWTYGAPVSECFSWRLVSLPGRGAIATIGNTGLGYGRIGNEATSGGGDQWITIEFFKQYAEEYNTKGFGILGDVFKDTVTSYVTNKAFDMASLEEGHAKTVQQWVLLGDPSLRLGGIVS